MSHRLRPSTVLGALALSVVLCVTAVLATTFLAGVRQADYTIPGLVTARGGSGAELASMSLAGPTVLVWVAVVAGLLALVLASRRPTGRDR